ncbi:histidine kinase [Chitinophagaceae bacterium MMS25-I14]
MKTDIYPGRSYVLACMFIFLVLLACSAAGQEYSYTHYDVKDGLPSSNIHNITQDKDGFIWFATESGLCRFDGTHFKTYTTKDGLPGNEVLGCWVDSKGRMWIKVFKNAICYYKDGKIHNQQNDPVLARIKLISDIDGSAEDQVGNLVFVCSDGSSYFIFNNNSIKRVNDIRSFDTSHFFAPVFINGGLAVGKYLQVADEIIDYRQKRSGVIGDNVTLFNVYLCKSKTEQNYILKNQDTAVVFQYNKLGRCSQNYEIIDIDHALKKSCMFADDSSMVIWNSQSGNGVFFYDIYRKKYTSCFLKDYCVHFMFHDREGNTWFSTGSGVFKLSPLAVRTINPGTEKNPLPVYDVHKVGKSIYAGCKNGEYYQLFPQVSESSDGTPACTILKVEPDITRFCNLGYHKLINCGSSDFLKLGKSRPQGSMKTLQFLGKEVLFADNMETFSIGICDNYFTKTIRLSRATCAYKQDSTYYVGTLGGLYAVTAGKPEIYLGDSNSLFKNQISSFAASDDGTLWIATNEKGVIGYKHGKITANITVEEYRLTSNQVRCLYTSGNTLWVGTDKGLNKTDISGAPVVTAKFTVSDGLNSDIINTILADSNIVYLGTPLGLCYFDERKIPRHSISYIHLTDIISSGSHILPQQNNFLLPHKDNNIRFEYAGICFLSEGNITYRYRLLGLKDEWQTTKENALSYPSLPSGQYTLQLEAINKFGDHSKMLEWHFEVESLLWERWWFRLLVLVAFLSLVWVLVQWRIRRIQGREAEKRLTTHKIIELEQMALRAQMNPHFIFNCLNSIQQYIMRHDAKGANRYLSRFAALVRQTLDHSSKMYVSLAEEVTFLDNYLELEKLQMNGSFEYSIHIDDGIDRSIQIPNMVIQPYIENAVKHAMGERGGGDRITLSFTENKAANKLVCIVEDNGIGINRSKEKQMQQHKSKGMSITQGRVEMLNQLYADKKVEVTIADRSEAEEGVTGTSVEIIFPV